MCFSNYSHPSLMKTTDFVQLAHFATGETGVQERTQGGPVRGRQSKALQLSAQVPPRLHSLPGSSVWSGGGLLPLLVAPGRALVLSWPLPGGPRPGACAIVASPRPLRTLKVKLWGFPGERGDWVLGVWC